MGKTGTKGGNCGIILYYFELVDLGRVVVDSVYFRKMGGRVCVMDWFNGLLWLKRKVGLGSFINGPE